MACNHCGGEYVVGEGGKLECNRCRHVIGDISLLFEKKNLNELPESPHTEKKQPAKTRETA